jgi:cytochrome c
MKHHLRTDVSAERTKAGMSILLTCSSAFFLVLILINTPDAVSVRAASAGNPIRGKDLFERRCGGCHALDTDREGPRLRNVYGRKAGNISTFKYSGALKSAHITWDEVALDKWLVDTDSVVPDNDMDFHVPKADERADIIEFLKESSGK